MHAKGESAQEKQKCAESLTGVATCLPYLGGEGRAPTADCCSGLTQALKSNKKCICVILKDRDDPDLGLKINITTAVGLPSLCKTPDNLSQCPVTKLLLTRKIEEKNVKLEIQKLRLIFRTETFRPENLDVRPRGTDVFKGCRVAILERPSWVELDVYNIIDVRPRGTDVFQGSWNVRPKTSAPLRTDVARTSMFIKMETANRDHSLVFFPANAVSAAAPLSFQAVYSSTSPLRIWNLLFSMDRLMGIPHALWLSDECLREGRPFMVLPFMRVTIDEVRDPQAQVPVPTPEINFVGEAIGTFIAWPRALIMSHIATPQSGRSYRRPSSGSGRSYRRPSCQDGRVRDVYRIDVRRTPDVKRPKYRT
ncbi:hypothetical protein LR48_Vigan10g076000 [Vigna angularis]|uniref:Uncharacterized protein n=1 Tax=Phaseolus angularis TaxID=3914 RepID=A0A0L9VIQ5_PHAAN|nr:hypothetical protein LR48_Vigan10g076000 [Vigna angularis]